MAVGGVENTGRCYPPKQEEEIEAILSLYPDSATVLHAPRDFPDSSCSSECSSSEESDIVVIKVLVPLRFADHDRDRAIVSVWLDTTDFEIATSGPSTNADDEKTLIQDRLPNFERTESGRHFHCQFSVRDLPPLELIVTMPDTYPESTPAAFLMSSAFLTNQQLTAICSKLDELTQNNPGLSLISTWVDWLENEGLKFLGLSAVTIATRNFSDDSGCDPRILNSDASILERLLQIIRYDTEVEKKVFLSSEHLCCICFETYPGTEFYQVEPCQHAYCKECLTGYLETQVESGNVQNMNCPMTKCSSVIPLNVLSRVLCESSWMHFQDLAFSRALDEMRDLVWCPRCRLPAACDENDSVTHLGRCAYCFFTFCTECLESWHQGRQCKSLEDKLSTLEKQKPDATEEERERIRRAKMDLMSLITAKMTTKPCPTCKWPIEKDEGCNKVQCTRCNNCMCYICGKKIDSYDHFNTRCELFTMPAPPMGARVHEMHEGELRLRAMLEVNPEYARLIRRCPTCRERVIKADRNNHLRCYRCRTSFCYRCRQRIIGPVTRHFLGNKKCLHHSDD